MKQGGKQKSSNGTNSTRNTRRKQRTIAQRIARKKTAFLKQLRVTCGAVFVAAHRVGIGKRTVYSWRVDDPIFAEAWDEAIDLGWDIFKQTGVERAMTKSDTLWTLIAKGKWPAEFNERIEHEIKSGETFKMLVNAVGRLIQQFVPKAQQAEAVTFIGELMGATPRIVRPQVTDGETNGGPG